MSSSRRVGQYTREPVTGDYSSIALFLRPFVPLYHTHFDSLALSSSRHIFVSCLPARLKHRRTLSYRRPLRCQQSYL